VNTTLLGLPATVKLGLVAVSRSDVAFRVKAPWVPSVILQPEKAAIPDVVVAEQLVSVPEPVFMVKVTGDNNPTVVTTSPLESSKATTGWVGKATPETEALGVTVKTILAAVDPATVKLLLVAVLRPGELAFKVNTP
jgi:hypothetical protein